MKSSNMRYLPQVDHLRAIAALWIVLYHGLVLIARDSPAVYESTNLFAALVAQGHSAVALFMVLSGFIFVYGVYGTTVDYRRFIQNRVLRIYPLFLTLLFFGLAANPTKFSLDTLITTVLPLADFQGFDAGPFTAMGWAVAVEFQFYLVFPFLLAFLNRNPVRLVIGVVACAVMLRVLAVSLGGSARDISYWHFSGRIDQFILGMGAAALLKEVVIRQNSARIVFAVTACSSIVALYGLHRLGGWIPDMTWKILMPTVEGVLYAALIVGYAGASDFLPALISKALAKIGEMSFSIYLLHSVVIAIVVRHQLYYQPTGKSHVDAILTTFVIVVPMTLLVSTVTYRVIELPFLSLRKKYIQSPAPLPDIVSKA